MELVHGVPITKYCDELNLPIRERLELFVPICQAIQHAHQKGIIHRDVKPSNVLVCLQDGKPVPKVIDFGVAKAMHQPLTESTVYTEFGAVVGTLEYMAPEQAEMSPLGVDTRADVYALGVLLYELLTGTTPLDRKRLCKAALGEVLRILKEEEPPKPSTRLTQSKESLANVAAQRRTDPAKLMKEVRGELDWIVMKCLEKDRTRRYETASGLARDVERHLADEAVEACPPSAGYRLRKLARRYKGVALAVALVLLALVGGMVGTSWGLVRAEQARQAEAEQRAQAEDKEREARAAAEEEGQAKVREAEQRQRAEELKKLAEDRKRQAEAHEQQALEEKRVAEAVRTFLQQDLLRQADATEQANALRQAGGGFEAKENPTIKELLDRAAAELTPAKIEARFSGQREVQASILRTVGETYQGIGEYRKAVEFLLRSSTTYREALGAEHTDTLSTLNKLGQAYLLAGRTAEAIAVHEQVRDARVKKLGVGHPDTLATLNDLAGAYFYAGRAAEAISLFEQVRDMDLKQRGADVPETLTTLNNLATAYQSAGRTAEAIALLQQVRDARIKQLGADHPDTLRTLDNLAEAYQDAGKTAQAIALLEQVRDARVKKLGAEHPDTLITLNNLAEAYQDAGRTAEAMVLHEQVRNASVKKLGADHPDTLITLNNLAGAYLRAGRMAEAIALYEQVRDALVKKVGADHPHTLTALSNLAKAYQNAGRTADAIPLFEQVRDASVKQLGADHPDTLITLNNLAGAYRNAGRIAEAISLYERVREAMVKKLGAEHPLTLNTLDRLAVAYQAAGKLEQALPLFQQAARGVEKRHFVHQYAAGIVGNLIDCHERLKQYEQAEAWRRKWLAVMKEKEGPQSAAYAGQLAALSRNLLLQQKHSEAENALRECLTLRVKLESDAWSTFNAKSLLGEALLGQKKYAEAEPLLKDGYAGMKKRQDQIPPPVRKVRLSEALERLVQLYEASGKKDEAARWRQELEAVKSAADKMPAPQSSPKK
jgi:DNA-binding SARP family transcriptional activator